MAPILLKKKLLLLSLAQQCYLLTCFTVQLQEILKIFYMNKRRLFNTIVASSLWKRNRFIDKLTVQRLRWLQRKRRSVWYKCGGNDMFWKSFINERCCDEKWKKNFRLTKEKFYALLEMLKEYIAPKQTSPNHRRLDADKKLAVCLYYLKDTGSMWMTANTFGIHQVTVSKVVVEVCSAIVTKLS